MSFTVRPGAPPDVPAILKLVRTSWARTYDPVIGETARLEVSGAKHVPGLFEGEISREDGISVAAFDEADAIIGYAGGTLRDDGYGFIDHIHVEPSWWGRGVAHGLLDGAAAQIASRGRGLELTVLDGNDRAMAFYMNYGFHVAAHEDWPESGMGGRGVSRMRYQFR